MIETVRLTLRPHRIDDRDAYAHLWRAPPAAYGTQVPQVALGSEDAWSRLLRFIGHRQAFGYAPLLVIDRASGTLFGEVGFAMFHRGIGPAFDTVPEAMWKIDWAQHGRGLATEAVGAALRWFDARGFGDRSVCIIHPDNAASLDLARRFGYAAFGTARYRDRDRTLFARASHAIADLPAGHMRATG